jgi:hypothetical protein
MKKLLTIAMVGVASVSLGWSQGEINFANFASGLNSPVTDTAGTALSGGTYLADLFYGTTTGNNNLTLGQLTDLGVAKAFSTGAGAGYFLGGSFTLPVSGNTEFIVVVWQASAGATWAAATGSPAGLTVGNSAVYSDGSTWHSTIWKVQFHYLLPVATGFSYWI